jgi:hypothetical protein
MRIPPAGVRRWERLYVVSWCRLRAVLRFSCSHSPTNKSANQSGEGPSLLRGADSPVSTHLAKLLCAVRRGRLAYFPHLVRQPASNETDPHCGAPKGAFRARDTEHFIDCLSFVLGKITATPLTQYCAEASNRGTKGTPKFARVIWASQLHPRMGGGLCTRPPNAAKAGRFAGLCRADQD